MQLTVCLLSWQRNFQKSAWAARSQRSVHFCAAAFSGSTLCVKLAVTVAVLACTCGLFFSFFVNDFLLYRICDVPRCILCNSGIHKVKNLIWRQTHYQYPLGEDDNALPEYAGLFYTVFGYFVVNWIRCLAIRPFCLQINNMYVYV